MFDDFEDFVRFHIGGRRGDHPIEKGEFTITTNTFFIGKDQFFLNLCPLLDLLAGLVVQAGVGDCQPDLAADLYQQT